MKEKAKKFVASVCLGAVALTSVPAVAMATAVEPVTNLSIATPYMTYIVGAGCKLSISGTTATVNASVDGDSTDATSAPAFAKVVQPQTDGYYTDWEIKSVNRNVTQMVGSYKLCYEGDPAKRAGQYATVGGSVSYTSGISGTIKVPVKTIEAHVGFEMGVSITTSASENSAPLEVGEYVKGYIAPVISYDEITQHRYYRIDGYTTEEKAICRTFSNYAAKIRIDYYKGNQSDNLLNVKADKPYKSEVYFVDSKGESILVDTEYFGTK